MKFILFTYETIDRFPTSSEPVTSVSRLTSKKNARNPTKVDKCQNSSEPFSCKLSQFSVLNLL